MRSFFLFFVFYFLLNNIFSQIILSGKIINSDEESIPYINILIYELDESVVIGFGVSNLDGQFSIELTTSADSLRIETSAIHYKREKREIANHTQEIPFILEVDEKTLETFTLRASPIERRGDTLSFLVDAFTAKSDRSIADVLRKMPGIEVETNGQILYQGLPIQKFYIEGLDLMDGRYAMVSNNLPHQSVATIEVYENHQPIRILEEKVVSQQASLNLKLNQDVTTTGKAILGTGFTPFLLDVNITPMTFTRKFQFVASYQTNNIGKDASTQLTSHLPDEFRKSLNHPNETPELLNIQTLNPPYDFDPTLYLKNNIHLLNLNALTKLNNNLQLRSNLHYITDFQQERASASHTIFTPEDTVTFNENFYNEYTSNYLQAVFTLSRNVKSNFLENKLCFKSNWNSSFGLLSNNSEQISQKLKSPAKSISNDLHSIYPLGKKLIEIRSYISYDENPHQLQINPGVFPNILNDEIAYENSLQTVELKRFYTENSIGMVYTFKGIVISPKAGFIIRQQTLQSILRVDDLQVSSGFENDQNIFNSQAFLQTEIQYRKRALTINFNLPLIYQTLTIDDQINNLGQDINRTFLKPRLFVNYKLKGFWEASASWSYSNNFGELDGVYYGFLLKSYRNLSQNNAPIAINLKNNLGVQLKYSNAIISFFHSSSFLYVKLRSNLLYNSLINEFGASVIEAVEYPNQGQYISFKANTSKYYSAIRSTFSLRLGASQQEGMVLMNAEIFNTINRFYQFSPHVLYRFKNWFNIEYGLNLHYFQNVIADNNDDNTKMLTQKMNLFVYPKSNQMLSLAVDYHEYKRKQSYFLDIIYRYSFSKRKIDLEMKYLNILNTKNYTTYQAFTNSIIESTYELNPSRFLISINFAF